MAGHGGFKHRKRRQDRRRTQNLIKARENIQRMQNKYEAKGQTWEPQDNPAQMAELTHAARRLVARSKYAEV